MDRQPRELVRLLMDGKYDDVKAACLGDEKVLEEVYKVGGTDLAVRDLESMAAVWPDSHVTWETLAFLASEDGYDSAADLYASNALKALPECPKCRNIRAVSALSTRRFSEAKPILEGLCRENPTTPMYCQNLAVLHHEQKQYDEALRVLGDALKHNARDKDLLLFLFTVATSCERERLTEAAAKAWSLILENGFLNQVAERKLYALGKGSKTPNLVQPGPGAKRWLVVSNWHRGYEKEFENPEVVWNASPRMTVGDTVFFYFTEPHKHIRYIGMVESDPWRDHTPGGTWEHWVCVSRVLLVPNPISLDTLRDDSRTKSWGATRALQGTHKLIPEDVAKGLAEIVKEANSGDSGFIREVSPLLRVESRREPANVHPHVQGLLASVGQKLGYDVRVPSPDVDRVVGEGGPRAEDLRFELRRLVAPMSPGQERAVANVDILWIRDGRIVRAIEVEATTNMVEGATRISQVPEEVRSKDFMGILAIPDDRKSRLAERLGALKATVRDSLRFCTFQDVELAAQTRNWKTFEFALKPIPHG